MNLRRLAMALAFALTQACSSRGSSSVTASGQLGDPAARIDFTGGITIPEGSAASAHVNVVINGSSVIADIDSADPTVLRVVESASDPSGYVFLGVSAGTTSVQVSADGHPVQTVSATVLGPPSTSLPPTVPPPIESVAPAGDGGPDDDSAVTPGTDVYAPDADAIAPDGGASGSDDDASAPNGDA